MNKIKFVVNITGRDLHILSYKKITCYHTSNTYAAITVLDFYLFKCDLYQTLGA